MLNKNHFFKNKRLCIHKTLMAYINEKLMLLKRSVFRINIEIIFVKYIKWKIVIENNNFYCAIALQCNIYKLSIIELFRQ